MAARNRLRSGAGDVAIIFGIDGTLADVSHRLHRVKRSRLADGDRIACILRDHAAGRCTFSHNPPIMYLWERKRPGSN